MTLFTQNTSELAVMIPAGITESRFTWKIGDREITDLDTGDQLSLTPGFRGGGQWSHENWSSSRQPGLPVSIARTIPAIQEKERAMSTKLVALSFFLI